MFGFFFVFSICLSEQFSLIPPLEQTNISEIGNWTLRGVATNMKSGIRLTSALKNRFGAVCQRTPTYFKEWTVDMEISAKGGDGGHGIWFYFTEDVCPEMSTHFKGFVFWINTTSTSPEGISDVYFLRSNNDDIDFASLKPIGTLSLRDKKKNLRMHVTRRFDYLTVDASKDIIFHRIFEANISGSPDYGYFTVASLTSNKTDNNDLLAFRVYPMSPPDFPFTSIDHSSKNRKIIEDSVIARREMKKKRRENMLLMQKYSKEAMENQNILKNNSKTILTDSISIIDEAYKRGYESITLQSLSYFIENQIDSAINQAQNKIINAATKLEDTKQGISELWMYLRKELLALDIESKTFLQKLEKEITDYAKAIKVSHINFDDVKNGLKSHASSVADSFASRVLLIISIIELFAYLVFFFVKRSSFQNRKKFN